MSSDGESRSAAAISPMKLAQRPMTEIRATNWHARITVNVTPRAPSCGVLSPIFGFGVLKSVTSSSDGRVLVAVRTGNRPFGKGAVGGGGKEVLEEMVGNPAHTSVGVISREQVNCRI
jgi:hypothetical protein